MQNSGCYSAPQRSRNEECACVEEVEGLFLPLFWAVDCKSGEWKASPTRQSEMIMLRNKHTTSNIVAKFSQKPREFPLDIAKLWWLCNELTLIILLRNYNKFSIVLVPYTTSIISQLKCTIAFNKAAICKGKHFLRDFCSLV